MSALVDAHIRSQARIRSQAVAAMSAAWQQLPNYDESSVPAFLERAVPISVASQRASIAITNAFIARRLGRQPAGVNPALILDATRNGATPADVYRRPFVTVWTALKNGTEYQAAIAAGMARATSSAAMDVQLAMRGTMQAVQDADPGIFGYQRVADGGACEYCAAIDGAYVKSANAMPLHNHCGCGLDPLTSPHPRATTLPDGTRIRDVRGGPLIDTPHPDAVAVHEHGELGAVLAPAGDHFTRL